MGYFYPPPPVFIGGRQPFAPRLGIPQSGPLPMAAPQTGPIALATLGILLASWRPPFFLAQGAADIAPTIPTPAASSQPPALNNAALFRVLGAWQHEPVTVLSMPSAAGNVAATPDQPQAVSRVNLDTLRRSWDVPFQLTRAPNIAPLLGTPVIPDQPPIPSTVNLLTVLRSWQQPFALPQGAGNSAPNLPVVIATPPPTQTYALLYRLRASWDPPFQMSARAGNQAPIRTPSFPGFIPGQAYTQNTGTQTLNTSLSFSGATSYSISPSPDTGIAFNTATGVISTNTTLATLAAHGPYTVTGTNTVGSVNSNTFTITVQLPGVGGNCYSIGFGFMHFGGRV